jgi:hypothetical protein
MRMGENDKCELVWLYVGNWHFDRKIMTTIDIHTLGFKICFWKKIIYELSLYSILQLSFNRGYKVGLHVKITSSTTNAITKEKHTRPKCFRKQRMQSMRPNTTSFSNTKLQRKNIRDQNALEKWELKSHHCSI